MYPTERWNDFAFVITVALEALLGYMQLGNTNRVTNEGILPTLPDQNAH